MQVDTKFNKGDDVFYVASNRKIVKTQVSQITVVISDNPPMITYTLMGNDSVGGDTVDEGSVFSTSADLIDSLTKQLNLF